MIDQLNKSFVDWPISSRGSSTRIPGNSLTSLEIQSKDLEAASLRLLDIGFWETAHLPLP